VKAAAVACFVALFAGGVVAAPSGCEGRPEPERRTLYDITITTTSNGQPYDLLPDYKCRQTAAGIVECEKTEGN
jgi:hypothetical protein